MSRKAFPRAAGEKGQAMLETAIVLPIILLVCVGIFEFGRVYQFVQVLTNAAREGARVAVLQNATEQEIRDRVDTYLQAGQIPANADMTIDINMNASVPMGATNVSASIVTVNYPYSFMVLNPVARLVSSGTTLGSGIVLSATAEMRNEVGE